MLLFERFNLGNGFREHFQIAPAIDDAQREQVFRIRHEVYCEELRFEPERPDRLETDAFDPYSLHCLLSTNHEPAEPVGCTRVIMARADTPDWLLPFERSCAHTLDRRIVDPARLPRGHIAEVSRLAVRASFRRRRGESHEEMPFHSADLRRSTRPRFPYIPIGLYLGAVALAARNGIDTLFILTEPRLAAHFARLGVEVRQIGSAVEHRGLRVPSMMDVQGIIRDMRRLIRPIWHVIQEEIENAYRAQPAGAPPTSTPEPVSASNPRS